MSKIFYDHLISLTKVEIHIKKNVETTEERDELWQLIDEIVHQRIITVILDNLPRQHHEEFLEKLHHRPQDERHLHYLNEKIESDIEELIKTEANLLEEEIMRELK